MELTCDGCGSKFASKRSDARYCSGRCRTEAYRVRRDGDKPKRPRPPLRPAVNDKMWDLERVVTSLDKLTADDRFPRLARSGDVSRAQLDRLRAQLDVIAARFPDSSQSTGV